MLREDAEAGKAKLLNEISYYESLKRQIAEEIARIDAEFSQLDTKLNELNAQIAEVEGYKAKLDQEKNANQQYVQGYDHEIAERRNQMSRLDQSVTE